MAYLEKNNSPSDFYYSLHESGLNTSRFYGKSVCEVLLPYEDEKDAEVNYRRFRSCILAWKLELKSSLSSTFNFVLG